MNSQGKKMMVDSLIKLVDSSPTKNRSPYIQRNQMYEISHQEYDTWINYVKSVLDILYEYSELEIIAQTQIDIIKIPMQNNSSYFQYTLLVERKLLDLASTILHYQ